MSGNSTLDPLAQDVIAQLPATFAANYVHLCVAVLLFYDYCLTLPLELQHIWQGKTNVVKILFISNRYISLVSVYAESGLIFCLFTFSLLTTSVGRSTFTLRTYVIYRRSRTVLFLLAAPALAIFSSSIWLVVTQIPIALPSELQIGPFACGFEEDSSQFIGFVCLTRTPNVADNLHTQLVNIISAAVFDVLVVILTVYRIGRLALQSKKENIGGSLSFIMARDGVLYYRFLFTYVFLSVYAQIALSAIFVPQLVAIALYATVLKTGSNSLGDVSDALGNISDAFEVILVNRLVLNLSHAANAREDSEFRTRTGLEPPTFAVGPVLGNIGGSVRTLPDGLDEDILEGDGKKGVDMTRMSNLNETGESGPGKSTQPGANFEIEEISV